MKTLVIVDLQKDFYDPKGALSVDGARKFPERIARLVPEYDNVFFTLDWHVLSHCSFKQNGGIWPPHCIQHSWGASLPDEVLKAIDPERQTVFYYEKGTRSYEEEYAAFKYIDDWQLSILRNSSEIGICGLCGDYCVGLTIDRLIELGLKDKLLLYKYCIGSLDGGKAFSRQVLTNGLSVSTRFADEIRGSRNLFDDM